MIVRPRHSDRWHELTKLTRLGMQRGGVYDVAFSPKDARTVASASQDATVRILDIETKQTFMLRGYDRIVWSCTFSPDGQYLATGCQDGTVWIWNMDQVRQVLNARPEKLLDQAEQDTGLRVSNSDGVISVSPGHLPNE